MKKSVYIAGPITGVDKYWEPFEAAMDAIEAEGFIALSPCWQPAGLTNMAYMRICLSMIDCADAVVFLPGSDGSPGARLERAYCEYIGKPNVELSRLSELKEAFLND